MASPNRSSPQGAGEYRSTRIVAIGSPHGDDQAGWLCAAALAAAADTNVSVATVVKPLDLIDILEDCRQLWIIDACVTGARPGVRHRWTWPQATSAPPDLPSTHGFGLERVLNLARALDKLPAEVTIFGLEIDPARTHGGPSPAVRRAVAALATEILDQLREQALARTGSSLSVAQAQEID